MIEGIDYTGKTRTRFVCDRCGKKLTVETRRGIYIQEHNFSSRKKWDLCIPCYKSLCRGIEKGKKGV